MELVSCAWTSTFALNNTSVSSALTLKLLKLNSIWLGLAVAILHGSLSSPLGTTI